MIQEIERKKGTVYVVRYYDPSRRSKYAKKSFDRKKDAQAFEAKVILAKRATPNTVTEAEESSTRASGHEPSTGPGKRKSAVELSNWLESESD